MYKININVNINCEEAHLIIIKNQSLSLIEFAWICPYLIEPTQVEVERGLVLEQTEASKVSTAWVFYPQLCSATSFDCVIRSGVLGGGDDERPRLPRVLPGCNAISLARLFEKSTRS